MIIFYGTKGKAKDCGTFTSESCENCKGTLYHLVKVFQYFYLYFIPVFPVKNKSIAICANCEKEYEDLSEKKKKDIKKSNLKGMIPVHYFSGIFIIFALIGLVAWASYQDSVNEKSYIESPRPLDYYIVDSQKMFKIPPKDGYKYTILKIASIDKTDVSFNISNYVYKATSHAEEELTEGYNYLKKDFFTQKTFKINRAKLKLYHTNGEISSIIRIRK